MSCFTILTERGKAGSYLTEDKGRCHWQHGSPLTEQVRRAFPSPHNKTVDLNSAAVWS